ncbi:MAG: MBL fold metallo-hydrolase [Bacteroidota bacterium]|nr:MBL fold metallo-hydrolase [Bacteroidota bacterium]MDP4192464.1 MBL fold metallo-hydrolase [Bacteroidota bacterium]MDP4196039.1 MBL fold metallo-hydrolase [Bacteroidota bacterium]
MKIRVLGSSSAGNCTLIWDSKSAIMIDCGFSPNYIVPQLDSMNMNISFLSGVFITHTHSDHVNKTMMKLLNRNRIPVYCHNNIKRDLANKFVTMGKGHIPGLLRSFEQEEIRAGEFSVSSFEVPHDSTGGCFGYNIFKSVPSGRKKITVATDLGYSSDVLSEKFMDSDVIVIESNHDLDMLENSGRPQYLKDRIRQIGHLSNNQCADFLLQVLGRSSKLPEAVVLAHISQQCNTGRIALQSARNALSSKGYDSVKVVLSYKQQANEVVCLE